MNIQDTIKELGLQDETLPRILNQRVNTVDSLKEKLELAKQEHEKDPTDDSQKSLEEVQNYTNEYFQDVVEQLKNHKAKLEAKAKKEAEKEEKKKEQKETAEAKEEKTLKEEVKAKKEVEPLVEAKPEEEKKSSGIGALLIGGVVLVATLGAVNILRNR